MKTLLILVGVFLVFRLQKPLVALHTVLRLRLWKPRARLVEPTELPPHLSTMLRPPMAALEALGFQFLGWMATERERPMGDTPRFHARLFNPATSAYATVSVASSPDPLVLWTVTFATFGADGRVVRTFDGPERGFLPDPPGTIAVEPWAPTTERQWEAHGVAVKRAALSPAPVDHDAAFVRGTGLQRAWFEALIANGTLLPAEPGAYVVSWPVALRAVRRVMHFMRRLPAQCAARAQSMRAASQPLPVVPLEEDVAAYARQVEILSGRPRASFLAALFLLSVPIFIVAGAFSSGAVKTTAIVLAIVLFHELGHYLAMRALGYVDTTIFFIPFLGGLAVGRKDDATVRQQMIVLLSGPVPGLLVAAAVAVTGWGAARFHDTVMLLIIVNLFNLLPILPLDGGQIAHTLLFTRHPWLDTCARAAAGVALLGISVVVSGVFLGVLGVATLVQLPKTRKQAELRRMYREARVASPGEPPVPLFFRVLRGSALGGVPFAQRVLLARTTLARATMDGPMGWRQRGGWLSAYAAAFALGCGALSAIVLGPSRAEARSADVSGEPVAMASVSCPVAPVPGASTTVTKAKERYPLFVGVAGFTSPESLEGAKARLEAAVPSVVLRTIGESLFVWVPIGGDAEEDDDDEDSKGGGRITAQTARVAGAVRSGNGTFFETTAPARFLRIGVECRAADEVSAQWTNDVLAATFVGQGAGIPIPGPWTETFETSDARRLARHTFRVAMETKDLEPLKFSLLSSLNPFRDFKKRMRDQMIEQRARMVRRAEASLAEERRQRPVDEEVARLTLLRIGAGGAGKDDVEDALRERLGAGGSDERVGVLASATSTRDGQRVRVMFRFIRPTDVDASILPLLGWLCARSCVDQRVLVAPPQ